VGDPVESGFDLLALSSGQSLDALLNRAKALLLWAAEIIKSLKASVDNSLLSSW
jgi:hypothetical protein|tara:strand:+ start:168 stop:329 length:162 start_codon:yes stop_codon:yes gene_type:complete